MEKKFIGRAVPRKEGRDKVTGRARYVDDLAVPDMLHGVTVRSNIARGRIRGIHFGEGIPWKEFTIVTAADIPGKNEIALIEHDQPCLADKEIHHPEEPIVLLAHPDRYLLEEARRAVRIDVEPLPAVFSIEDSALAKSAVIFGEDNIFKSYRMEKGDVDAAWAHADVIVEGEYRTGAQEQLYIENQGMVALANSSEGVTVWGSLQCTPTISTRRSCQFSISRRKTSGSFKRKQAADSAARKNIPSLIAAHAALLAWKSGKPVKMVYDRAEDMVATTKRHPSRTRHRDRRHARRQGSSRMDIDFVIDGGAYATLLFRRALARNDSRSGALRLSQRGAFTREPWRQMRRRMELSAASARPNRFLPWSATWIRWRGL